MKKLLFIAASVLLLAACKGDPCDDPSNPDCDDHHEGELITTVRVNFTDSANVANTLSFEVSDPDGDGGNAPTIDSMIISDSTTWIVDIEFIDESDGHEHDITAEIKGEADEHFVCFSTTVTGLTIEATDSDGTHPLGVDSKWWTMAAGTGNVTITLKHQPGTKDGTCAPGETDAEVTFPVVIQ